VISFTVPLVPVAKGRPRVFGKRAITPPKTLKFEQTFAVFAAEFEPDEPIDEPVAVSFAFYLPRPKRLMRKRDPDGAVPCGKRPDIDNLCKSALDAMARWWRDDSLVVRLVASKFYAEKLGKPRIEVRVMGANDD